MHTTSIGPSQAAYSSSATPADLPPELLLLAAMVEHKQTQSNAAKDNVAANHERLVELRDRIAEAMERAREAQENAGLWGDISNVFGGDIATIAGVVASAALVVGTGGAGAAVVVAALAVGFTAGGEIAEECGADPKVVMAFKLAGAAVGLLGGNAAQAGALWGTIHTAAKVTEGGAIAAGGGGHIVEGQYQGDARAEQGQATYFRRSEQLESQLADEEIARIEKLFEQMRFLMRTGTAISANNQATDQSVIRRIGG